MERGFWLGKTKVLDFVRGKDNEMQLNNNIMQKILAFFGACALFILCCTSCKTTKIAKDIYHIENKDSISTAKKLDSLVKVISSIASVRETSSEVTSTEKSDTGIGFEGRNISFVFDPNSIHIDSFLLDGIMTFHIYKGSDGLIRIDCKTDSFTKLVRNITKSNTNIKHSLDSIIEVNTYLFHFKDSVSKSQLLHKSTHTELTVKTESKSWWGRIWDTFKKWCVWIVLLELIAFLLWLFFGRK